MDYQVRGGKKLSGSVTTNTSKNATIALMVASLLNKGKTTIKRVPNIEEVSRLEEVLRSIDVKIERVNGDMIITPPARLAIEKMDIEAAQRTRIAYALISVFAHQDREFVFPVLGGCRLGQRSMKPTLRALSMLGIKTEGVDTGYRVDARELAAGEVIMPEASDVGTEMVLIAAARIPGVTTIRFASANYMVQDVCVFLQSLGVKVEGIGNETMVVHGISEINTEAVAMPSEDPIESMFFISLAATTKSELVIKRCPMDFLELELMTLELMGLAYERTPIYKGDNGFVRLADLTIKPSELVACNEKIAAQPYPAINADNLPFFVPIATQAKGRTLIHDWMYEERAAYFVEFKKLGGDVMLADPHRVFIEGPTKLHAVEMDAPPALRPATILFIGMLAAEGKSVLRNVYQINRGYERLHERLKEIGADVEAIG